MRPEPRWAWCDECNAWVGAAPPRLGTFYPNEQAARLHRTGTGHKARLLTIAQTAQVSP